MAKIRVHELAKEREMSPRDMLAKLQAAGLPVKAVASAPFTAAAGTSVDVPIAFDPSVPPPPPVPERGLAP